MMTYIFWALLIIFGGYLLNRIIFWIAAYLLVWADFAVQDNKYWFRKNSTIKDINDRIKNEHEDLFDDSYRVIYGVRWVPILNITGAITMLVFCLFAFLAALIIIFCRIINYIAIFVQNHIIKPFVQFIRKLFGIKWTITSIKEKFLNLKIA